MSEFESDMWDRDDDDYIEEPEVIQRQVSNDMYDDDDDDMYDDDEDDEYEDAIDDLFDDDEEFEVDEVSFMKNARVRLEQARLYELLIEHDLFDGVDAAPEAVDRVQGEIKAFIVDRLEILLGMKNEKETEIQQIIHPSQFNDVEVKALKMIASKVTKGASTDAPTTEPEPSELNTIKKEAKRQGLNTLGTKKPVVKPKPVVAQPKPKPKPVRKPEPKPAVKKEVVPKTTKKKALRKNPKKSAVKSRKLKKEMMEVSSKGKTVDELAKRDMKYVESLKNKSLEEASKIVSQRHNRPRSTTPIDQGMVNSHYTTKVAMSDSKMSDYGKIMKLAALQKAQE